MHTFARDNGRKEFDRRGRRRSSGTLRFAFARRVLRRLALAEVLQGLRLFGELRRVVIARVQISLENDFLLLLVSVRRRRKRN